MLPDHDQKHKCCKTISVNQPFMKTSRLLELGIAGHWSVCTIVQDNITQAQCQQMILYNN